METRSGVILRDIFDKYRCDKGSLRHRYDRVYGSMLIHLRNKEFNILEIGILAGASLKSWIDFFPKANIYAIDIFTRVPVHKIRVLKNPRISYCNCDSVKGPNKDFIEMVGNTKFDVIIDDGSHNYYSQRRTFENFILFLNNTGIYFIEDILPFNHSDDQYNKLIRSVSKYTFNMHDLRKGYCQDTFIIEVRK